MSDSLRGRIEIVSVKEQLGQSRCAYGFLKKDGRKVMVNHATPYINQEVLARFSLQGRNPQKICNFITDKVPGNFKSLSPEDYILCGMWPDQVKQHHLIPNLYDFSECFSPGDLSVVYYLKNKKNKGLYKIDERGIIPYEVKDLSVLIERKLPDARKAARMILVDDQRDLSNLMTTIERSQVRSIVMKSIK